jgi:RsiW-degrading membrane proteinase PrsW (M82 family)
MKFSCPFCAGSIEGEESWIGLQGDCPLCGKIITVPKPDVPQPPPLPQHTASKPQPATDKAAKPEVATPRPAAPLVTIDTTAIAAKGVDVTRKCLKTLNAWIEGAIDKLPAQGTPVLTTDALPKTTASVQHEKADSPATDKEFPYARLVPLTIYILGLGYVLTWLLPNRLYLNHQVLSVLMLAVPSLVLAVLSSAYFIRPKLSAKIIWLCSSVTGFTITVGLASIVLFMKLAESSLSWTQHLHGRAAGLELILKVIGFAARATESENLLAKFFGYIIGVGLCEEVTKLLPLFIFLGVVKHRSRDMCRVFLVLGFFSGLGFGIGEALYRYAPWSSDLRVFTDDNITRWFACVPSHAVYTVIDAAFLWILAPRIRAANGIYTCLGLCAVAVLAVAVLHGVYNVLCGLQILGFALDGLSIVMIYYIVNYAFERTPASVEGLGILSGAAPRIATWVLSYQTGVKRLVRQYIFATMMIIASLFFSTSEDTIRALMEQYRRQEYSPLDALQNRYSQPSPQYRQSRCLQCGGYGHATDPFSVGGGAPPRQISCPRCGGTGIDPQR